MIFYYTLLLFLIVISMRPLWRQVPKIIRIIRFGWKRHKMWSEVIELESQGHAILMGSDYHKWIGGLQWRFYKGYYMKCTTCGLTFYADGRSDIRIRGSNELLQLTCSDLIIRDLIE